MSSTTVRCYTIALRIIDRLLLRCYTIALRIIDRLLLLLYPVICRCCVCCGGDSGTRQKKNTRAMRATQCR